MSKRIKINIPSFGKRFCSDNVKYEIIKNDCFHFYYLDDNGYQIIHNEYGPASEYKNGTYQYWVNGKLHRLDGPAVYIPKFNIKHYHINGVYIGKTEEEFIKYKNKYLLE